MRRAGVPLLVLARVAMPTALALLLQGPPRPAAAAALTVTDCGDTTPGGAPGQLRRLIDDAAPGDTIAVPACIITLTGAADEDANAGGDLDIAKDLTIQGAGARRTVIDGGGIDRVLDVQGGATAALRGLMIRNGRAAGAGGGVRNLGNLQLERVIVLANTAEAGGGISNDSSGTLALVEAAVVTNSATGGGGGLSNTADATLVRSNVSRNAGGGIGNSGPMSIWNSTIAYNSGGGSGPGGILNAGVMAGLTLVNSTIVGNDAAAGTTGGLLVVGPPGAAIENTLIADNGGGNCGGSVFRILSVGGNLSTDATCGLSGPGDQVVADAGVGPLSAQGGPTATVPLLPGSPAIDAALAADCPATDQRGRARPQGAGCDTGAFEFTPPAFADVPAAHGARGAIEALLAAGVTAGCGTAPLVFCPDAVLTRAQLSVLLLRALDGPGFTPLPATGVFADVPPGDPFAPWIEALWNRGITSGCAVAPPRFCPESAVTRGQLAVLLLRALSVPGFVPPAATGLFTDVPASDPFAPWVEEFARRDFTAGCQAVAGAPAAYCPADPATRAQTAVFLARAFGFAP